MVTVSSGGRTGWTTFSPSERRLGHNGRHAWSSCSTRAPRSSSASATGRLERSSRHDDGAAMEFMFDEASELDQCVDDWSTAVRTAQRRLEHSDRLDDGGHVQRDLQARPVHRRLGRGSPRTQWPSRRWSSCSTRRPRSTSASETGRSSLTSAAVLGTLRPLRRWSSCSTRPTSLTSASTIGTQQLGQRSGACDTAAVKTMDPMSSEAL